jgi:hypothetical protein
MSTETLPTSMWSFSAKMFEAIRGTTTRCVADCYGIMTDLVSSCSILGTPCLHPFIIGKATARRQARPT